MKRFKFKKLDAFAEGCSSGNPAGCVYLDKGSDISDDEMQWIARELKGFVSEVVYLFIEDNAVRLRYYSSECEVDFCGHGTIAMMYDYIANRPELLKKDEITIRVKAEELSVSNRIAHENAVYITAPKPIYHPLNVELSAICQALGIDLRDLDGEYEPALIHGGLNTLIVPVANLQTALSMRPDEALLKAFCLDNQMDIVLIFCKETAKRESGYRTRVFAPKFGYLEDPATGSGNSAFGYYLLKNGNWAGAPMVIEQGPSLKDPNIIRLMGKETDGTIRVLFGGGAVVRIDGEYCL